jgi:hypothetical protein
VALVAMLKEGSGCLDEVREACEQQVDRVLLLRSSARTDA